MHWTSPDIGELSWFIMIYPEILDLLDLESTKVRFEAISSHKARGFLKKQTWRYLVWVGSKLSQLHHDPRGPSALNYSEQSQSASLQQQNYGIDGPFSSWIYPLTMVVFHSYVSYSGWCFGTWMDYDFPFSWEWNVIIPTDELHHFAEG